MNNRRVGLLANEINKLSSLLNRAVSHSEEKCVEGEHVIWRRVTKVSDIEFEVRDECLFCYYLDMVV
jgi:hypothetical protein